MTGVWFVYEAFGLQRAVGGDQFRDFYEWIPVFKYLTRAAKNVDDPVSQSAALEREIFLDGRVNWLGWIGWGWVAVYEPVITTLWLVGNWSAASGQLKFARAISVGVSALPLTVDTKARYGDVLEKKFGKPFRCLFTIISAVACLYLGVLAVLLICLAFVDWHNALQSQMVPIFPVIVGPIIYILFVALWAARSFRLFIPNDEGLGVRTLPQFLKGLGMGVFGILFVAMPGIVVAATASKCGLTLNEYLACESVAIWQRGVAFLP